MSQPETPRPSSRGPLLELILTVAVPTAVLILGSPDDRLGPVWALVLALVFPLGHAVSTVVRSRRVSPVTALVSVSILLTGGIGLLELDVRWFAWKEAAFPLMLGVLAVASVRTRWPVLPALLGQILDGERLAEALESDEDRVAWERSLVRATWQLGLVFLLTAVGTFAFARWAVTSPTGTEAFTSELGWYTGWSFPLLGLPGTGAMMWILWRVLRELEDRTGRRLEELLVS